MLLLKAGLPRRTELVHSCRPAPCLQDELSPLHHLWRNLSLVLKVHRNTSKPEARGPWSLSLCSLCWPSQRPWCPLLPGDLGLVATWEPTSDCGIWSTTTFCSGNVLGLLTQIIYLLPLQALSLKGESSGPRAQEGPIHVHNKGIPSWGCTNKNDQFPGDSVAPTEKRLE